MTTSLAYLESAWQANPFDSDVARTHSSYCAPIDHDVVHLLDTQEVTMFERVGNAAFRAYVQDTVFPCLGARAAVARNSYRLGAYARLDDAAVTEGLARDLAAFRSERRGFETDFTTFVALFRTSDTHDERSFEAALWSQLQRLHELDARFHGWDPKASNDPSDPNFAFSFAGTGFFVVGLHPYAIRTARRFGWTTLVFNAFEQFEHLRDVGQFTGLQTQIRSRDEKLDGAINPNLSGFGTHSEARQYAGGATDSTWQCPFQARKPTE